MGGCPCVVLLIVPSRIVAKYYLPPIFEPSGIAATATMKLDRPVANFTQDFTESMIGRRHKYCNKFNQYGSFCSYYPSPSHK
ncbi:hypothetical protein OE88DRAFT_1652360 [Heliocybe sulcata]|uniref:Uncharacterized protein n=1 Tax=Heliocybe sulcata TaxID=5364 RepID=A0A5C3NES4_9AGAM|nr:hypothetical protein OE88DRAFT_1652360 [Heliocybe sulcata]